MEAHLRCSLGQRSGLLLGTRIKGPGDSLDTDMDTKEQFFGGAPPLPSAAAGI